MPASSVRWANWTRTATVRCNSASRKPPVTGEDGRAAVALVEAGYRSNQTGQAVSLAD